MFREVPRDRAAMITAGASTSSIPVMLGNVMSKTLEQTWMAADPTWKSCTTPRTARDFKEQTSLRPIFAGNLQQVGPGGEIKHGSVAEFYFRWSVKTFAKIYKIPRQHIINDDLSAFFEVAPSFAQAAIRNVSDLVYYTLMANAGPFFSAGNGNTQTGGSSALSSSSLSTAVQKLRLQKDPAGNSLGIAPAVLVVPPALESIARGILNSQLLSRDHSKDLVPTGNPLQGLARLEVEPRLENGVTDPDSTANAAGSASRWYLFSEPINLAMVIGFLNNQQTPAVETFGLNHDADTLSMAFRCYHDVGCAFGDFRAAQHSAGA